MWYFWVVGIIRVYSSDSSYSGIFGSQKLGFHGNLNKTFLKFLVVSLLKFAHLDFQVSEKPCFILDKKCYTQIHLQCQICDNATL